MNKINDCIKRNGVGRCGLSGGVVSDQLERLENEMWKVMIK